MPDYQCSGIVAKAYRFAEKAHLGQKRKTGEAYITHPIEVAAMVRLYGGDDTAVCAALLHDVIEDTPVTLDEIKEEFGRDIAFIVNAITKVPDNQELTHRKIINGTRHDKRVILVKALDRLHNLQHPLPDPSWHQKYTYETQEFYIPVARVFSLDNIADQLEEIIHNIERDSPFT